MKKVTFYLLTLFLVVWAQMALNYYLGELGFSANVILIGVLFFGLSRGPLPGQLLGFLWGLLIDASTLGLMGQHALLYAAAGFLSGSLRRQLDENKAWTQCIFTLGMSVMYMLFYFILDRVFSQGPHPMSWSMLAQPILNSLLAPVLFWIMQGWSEVWSLTPRES
jgi:rod shape-determining protein MreD